MGLDDSIILAMEPDKLHAVTELAADVGSGYDKVFFALSRLCALGFVKADQDNYWSLTDIGKKLRRIYEKRETDG